MKNEKNNLTNFLHLTVKISENSFGIFDKSHYIEKEFDINDKVFGFLNNDNQIIVDKNQGSQEDDEIILFHIRERKEEFYSFENILYKNSLKPTRSFINSLNYKLWYVIKNYPEENEKNIHNINENNINEDYYLCENDIIRLGNFKFILREIHLKNYNKNIVNHKDKLKYDIHDINKNNNLAFEFTQNLENYILTENKDIICSSCKKSICNKDNPIISLCNCESYQNKHYECLKEALELKIAQNDKKTSTNYIVKIRCKDCKNQLPLSFKIRERDRPFDLIDFDKHEDKDYLFFESFEYLTEYQVYEKSFHLIELNTDDNNDNDVIPITIGRDGSFEKHRDNDIKIFEPSVSRGKHAVIDYNKKEGTLLLKNMSKTSYSLVIIKDILKINRNKIHLQIGRTFIEACLLDKNEIKEIKKIKTRSEYNEEMNKKRIEEEEKLKESEILTNENFFVHSEEENDYN